MEVGASHQSDIMDIKLSLSLMHIFKFIKKLLSAGLTSGCQQSGASTGDEHPLSSPLTPLQ